MRERFSMDYGWQFYKGALELQKGKNHDIIYASTKAGGAPGPAQEDWNDENWQQVNLPHDWVVGEAFDPACTPAHGFKPRGMGWNACHLNLFSIGEANGSQFSWCIHDLPFRLHIKLNRFSAQRSKALSCFALHLS